MMYIYFPRFFFYSSSIHDFTVEKQCPQCQRVGTISLALEEPLIPKVMPFFQPFAESMEMMLKVDLFRSNQLKITMQRFQELVHIIRVSYSYHLVSSSFIIISYYFYTAQKLAVILLQCLQH